MSDEQAAQGEFPGHTHLRADGENEPPTGTTLERAVEPAPTPEPPMSESAESPSETPSESEAETILLVDDDKVFCGALAGAFRRRGFCVVVAHNHDDAVAEAGAWTPARALVDLRMPGKGGLEVVSELLKLDPQMRIIVLTGYGSIATAVEAIKMGAVHYLTKPASVDEIMAAFDRTVAVTEIEAPAAPRPLDEVEWEHLQKVLTDCGGNVSEAARRLGMHRRSLQRKLARGRPEA